MCGGCVSNSLIVDNHFAMVVYQYVQPTIWLLVKGYRH